MHEVGLMQEMNGRTNILRDNLDVIGVEVAGVWVFQTERCGHFTHDNHGVASDDFMAPVQLRRVGGGS